MISRQAPQCRQCGYSLAGLAGSQLVCPECGVTQLDSSDDEPPSLIGSLGVTCGPGLAVAIMLGIAAAINPLSEAAWRLLLVFIFAVPVVELFASAVILLTGRPSGGWRRRWISIVSWTVVVNGLVYGASFALSIRYMVAVSAAV